MQLEDLKTLLQPVLTADLDALYGQFQDETGEQTLDHFLAFLFRHKLLDDRALEKLQSWQAADEPDFFGDEDGTQAGDGTYVPGRDYLQEVSAYSEPTRYTVLETVGKGAMGEISLARDQELLRKVAYKRMHPEIAKNRKILARFLREVQITAQLEHPHIIPVYSLEATVDGTLAYAMKLIQGKTLKALVGEARQMGQQKKPLDEDHSLPALLEHFLNVCDALHYAHSKGVIHRDLKPANIMIGPYNEVYVMDWGIARLMGGAAEEIPAAGSLEPVQSDLNEPLIERTQIGQIIGTPRYMSPEQAQGRNEDLDGRSDQFALGLILYELVTLKPAIVAKGPAEVLKRILMGQKEPMEHAVPGIPVPPELKAIVDKSTALKPGDRYPDVAAMAEDIRRYLRGEAVQARPDNLLQGVLRWMNQHRQATLVLTLGILSCSALAIISSLYNQQMALAAARQRETRFNALLTEVSQQAQRIDTHFLEVEALLKGLAGAATQVLLHGQPSQEPFYTHNPFLAPDLIPSTLFGGKISVNWPTMAISPGVDPAAIRAKLQQLVPLRHELKQTALMSYTRNFRALSPARIERLIAEEGTPVLWSHVTIKEGAIYYFPGIGFNTPGYDARERPFYKLSAHKFGIYWGNPYFDPLSGPLLPCTTSLYDPQRQFLGVAGVDLRFKYIIESLMQIRGQTALTDSFLLDDKAQVILRASDKDKYIAGQKIMPLNKGFQTPLFHQQAVVAAVAGKQEGGYIESLAGEKSVLTAYARLNTLGWYYVVVADSARLLSHESAE